MSPAAILNFKILVSSLSFFIVQTCFPDVFNYSRSMQPHRHMVIEETEKIPNDFNDF